MVARPLRPSDVDAVIERVQQNLRRDAERNPFINPHLSTTSFRAALLSAVQATWVAERDGRVTGHLYGAVLADHAAARGVWTGPDGVSFDRADDLAALYAVAESHWAQQGAREHFVWVYGDDTASDVEAWFNLGFRPVHQRGVRTLPLDNSAPLPKGFSLRRGDERDLVVAMELDHLLDLAQRDGNPASPPTPSTNEDLRELLGDDEVQYLFLLDGGDVVGQAVTFALAPQRGSFDHTLHLSAVVLRDEYRGRGLGRALVDAALAQGSTEGFRFVDVNWRITNVAASQFWRRYGFRPTYTRLRRALEPS